MIGRECALIPGLRVLPAADCFPVGISGRCGQTRLGLPYMLFLSIETPQLAKPDVNPNLAAYLESILIGGSTSPDFVEDAR